jgi:hypothetical protein
MLRWKVNNDERIARAVRNDLLSAGTRRELNVVKVEAQNQQVIGTDNIRRETHPLSLPSDG